MLIIAGLSIIKLVTASCSVYLSTTIIVINTMWLSLTGKWCRSNLAVIIGRSRLLSPRGCRVPNEPTRSEAVTLENLSSSLMLRRRVCNVCLGCRVTSLPNECAVAPIAARIICAPNSIPSVQCAPHNQLTGYIHRNARSRSAVRIAGFAATLWTRPRISTVRKMVRIDSGICLWQWTVMPRVIYEVAITTTQLTFGR